MLRRTTVATFFVALFLALPIASATWYGRGYYEPDTEQDTLSGSMFVNPDTDGNPNVRKVYFNVQAYQDDQQANPNVAATGSRVMAYPTRMHAMLGVWKDCNQDGYVGHQEGFLLWYPSQLLPTTDVCPPETVSYAGAPPLVHNDGTFVREWLSIGPDNGGSDFEFNFNDTSARIWGDWGLPASGAFPTCALTPHPEGTFQSSGGFLRYSDCHIGWRVTTTVNEGSNLTGTSDLIGFHDAPRERPDQSASLLNQANPYGDPDDDPAVDTFDCDAEPQMEVTDPTGGELPTEIEDPSGEFGTIELADEEGRYWWQYTPNVPPGVNPDGSVAASYAEIESGLWDCDLNEEDSCGTIWLGPDQHSNGDFYCYLEVPHEGVKGARSQSDFYFDYFEGGAVCGTGIDSPDPTLPYDPYTPLSCTPSPQHITAEGSHTGYLGFLPTDTWFGNPSYTSSRNPYVNKETLQPWGASYATFYASVGTVGLTLPPSTGTYGSSHCASGVATTGKWQCDASKWWLGAEGQSIKSDSQVTVGQAYQLLDVDCYDQTVASGTPSVLSAIGEGVCARPQ